MKKKNMVLDMVMLIIFIIGVGALIYPFVSNSVNHFLDQQIINYYQDKANKENEEEMDRIHAEMEAKNKEIARQGAPGVDPYIQLDEEASVTRAPLSFYEEHTIGIVTIPEVNIRLPIYDQTLPVFLEKGAALLEGTSFPTGGESTHSVITSHTGISQASLFNDLDKLEIGDEFFIEINSRTHAYKIDQIKIVLPTETDDVKIVEGEDFVTLLTCTPYMINSHRLLVRGHRIPYVPQVSKKFEKVTQAQRTNMLAMGVMVVGIGLFSIWMFYKIIVRYMISKRMYSLSLKLTDDEGHDFSNVRLNLLNVKGDKAIRDESGQPIQLRTDEKGEIHANNLKGGKYLLENKEENLSIVIDVKQVKATYFKSRVRKGNPTWKTNDRWDEHLIIEKN